MLQLEAGAVRRHRSSRRFPTWSRLAKDPEVHGRSATSGGASYSIGFNTTAAADRQQEGAPGPQLRHRPQALRRTPVLQGFSEPQVLPWPPHSPAYDAAKNSTFTYDLDKARKLVDESGLKGAEVDVIYNADGVASQFAALSQIMQADAAKIGLKLNVKPMGGAAWNAASKDLAFPFVNLATTSFANLEPSTNFLMSSYWTPASNNEGFKSERYEQLLDHVRL